MVRSRDEDDQALRHLRGLAARGQAGPRPKVPWPLYRAAGPPRRHSRARRDGQETLSRELLEETGVNLLSVRDWRSFTIHLGSDSGGRPIDFHHKGWIAEVEVGGTINHNIIEEDVTGIVLADNLSGEQLSPLAHEALRLYPPYIAGTIRTI